MRIYLVVEMVKHTNPEEIWYKFDQTYFSNCIIEASLQQRRPFNLWDQIMKQLRMQC